MRKRVDHDATQEVSSSQLVPDAKPPVFTGPKNDASMWLQAPVSADDFVRAAKRKPRSGGRAVVIGLTVVGLVAVTGAGVWYALLREPTAQTSAFAGAGSAGSASTDPRPEQPAVTASASDAGVAEVATAPPDAAAPDAGAAAAGALQVDAVSAADPAPEAPKKKPTKKRPAKKKVTKKKTAKRR